MNFLQTLKKLHEELDIVIGDVNKLITLPDKSQLPYCQAFMMVSIVHLF